MSDREDLTTAVYSHSPEIEQAADQSCPAGRNLLQPFTTVGDDGDDIYTVIDDDTGEVRQSRLPSYVPSKTVTTV